MRMGHSRHISSLGLLWMSQKLSCLLCTTCCVHDKRCPIERTIVIGVAFCHCLASFNLDWTSAASFDFWSNFFADFCCGFFGDFALFLFCGPVVWFLFFVVLLLAAFMLVWCSAPVCLVVCRLRMYLAICSRVFGGWASWLFSWRLGSVVLSFFCQQKLFSFFS